MRGASPVHLYGVVQGCIYLVCTAHL
jgi:hypothetical protein